MENTHVCSEQSCERTAHSGFLSNPRKTHSLPIFAGMTCFEMLHSPLGCETWGYKEGSHGKTHSVNYGHPLVRSCGHVMVYQGRLLESIMPHSSTNQRHWTIHMRRMQRRPKSSSCSKTINYSYFCIPSLILPSVSLPLLFHCLGFETCALLSRFHKVSFNEQTNTTWKDAPLTSMSELTSTHPVESKPKIVHL